MEDDKDKPVKDAVPEPGDKPVADPVPPPVEHKPDDQLKGMVERLQEEVSGLRTLVESVVNEGEPDMDKSPVRKPWTHWKPGAR
jgi:hypothetical protein